MISPRALCRSRTNSTARRTAGHMCRAKSSSPVSVSSCQTPTARYAAWLDSEPGSVTSPMTHLAGHEPSSRCAPRSHSYARRAGPASPAVDSAIAASTWFQASTWPGRPSMGANHGMAPEGSCWAAIEPAVATRSSRVKIPGTASGRRMRPLPRCRYGGFGEVHDDALADHRVQHAVGQAGGERALHDVPDQEPVVGAGGRVGVVVHADGALDPPVRRVQAVRVVVPADLETDRLQLGLELGARVDAHVPARGRVVVL